MKGSVLTCVILYALYVYEGCDVAVVSSFSSKALYSRCAFQSSNLPFVSNNKLNQASACSGARRKTAWFLTSSNSASDAPKDDALSEISYKQEDFTEEMFLKIEEDLPKLQRFRKDLEEFMGTPEGKEDKEPLTDLLGGVKFQERKLRAAYDQLVESVQGHPNFSMKNHTVTYLRETITQDFYEAISDDLTELEVLENDILFHMHGYPLDNTLKEIRAKLEDKLNALRAAYDKWVESVRKDHPNFSIKNHTVTYLRETITQDCYEAISDDLTELEILEKDVLYYLHRYPLDDTLKEVRAKLEDKLKALRAAYDKLVEFVLESHPNFSLKDHTVTYLRETITQDFYETISNDLTKLEILEKDILFHLHRYPLDRTLDKVQDNVRSKLKVLRTSKTFVSAALDNRIAPINYRITSSMTYRYDYDKFVQYVENLFNWWNEKHEYMAPCLSMVQSSGSGKTKLLVQYKQDYDETTVLILCVAKSLQEDDPLLKTFDTFLLATPKTLPFVALDRDNLRAQLDSIVEKVNSDRVVLLFDEAQYLLNHDNSQEDRGFYYRVVRWWLRKNKFMKLKKQVVAVFTGTSTRLANFFQEDPGTTLFSRDGKETYNTGTKLYDPFYQLRTIGLEKYQVPAEHEDLTDFDLAAYYGRPLFGRLAAENRLDNKTLDAIRTRMLMHYDDQTNLSDTSCLSVLGTRVQMGITSFQTASTLVAGGYASLTYASATNLNFATMTFFPDPVPAYLAMTLMIRNEDMSVVHANEPPFWTAKASQMFTTGLCLPAKGEIGEIVAALYFLFCGDVLRLAIDSSLKTFAVPLSHLLRLAVEPKNVTNVDAQSLLEASSVASVKFIQVCRSYLKYSLKELIAKGYLEEWYTAGLALYNYPYAKVYDIIAPVRVGEGNLAKYHPMLISVKNSDKSKKDRKSIVKTERAKMVEYLEKETDEQTGVCILLATGLAPEADRRDFDTFASLEDKLKLWNGKGILFVAIAVPQDDCFGCWKLGTQPSSAGGNSAEDFASHFMVHQSSDSAQAADRFMRDNL